MEIWNHDLCDALPLSYEAIEDWLTIIICECKFYSHAHVLGEINVCNNAKCCKMKSTCNKPVKNQKKKRYFAVM